MKNIFIFSLILALTPSAIIYSMEKPGALVKRSSSLDNLSSLKQQSGVKKEDWQKGQQIKLQKTKGIRAAAEDAKRRVCELVEKERSVVRSYEAKNRKIILGLEQNTQMWFGGATVVDSLTQKTIDELNKVVSCAGDSDLNQALEKIKKIETEALEQLAIHRTLDKEKYDHLTKVCEEHSEVKERIEKHNADVKAKEDALKGQLSDMGGRVAAAEISFDKLKEENKRVSRRTFIWGFVALIGGYAAHPWINSALHPLKAPVLNFIGKYFPAWISQNK